MFSGCVVDTTGWAVFKAQQGLQKFSMQVKHWVRLSRKKVQSSALGLERMDGSARSVLTRTQHPAPCLWFNKQVEKVTEIPKTTSGTEPQSDKYRWILKSSRSAITDDSFPKSLYLLLWMLLIKTLQDSDFMCCHTRYLYQENIHGLLSVLTALFMLMITLLVTCFFIPSVHRSVQLRTFHLESLQTTCCNLGCSHLSDFYESLGKHFCLANAYLKSCWNWKTSVPDTARSHA